MFDVYSDKQIFADQSFVALFQVNENISIKVMTIAYVTLRTYSV